MAKKDTNGVIYPFDPISPRQYGNGQTSRVNMPAFDWRTQPIGIAARGKKNPAPRQILE